MVAEVIMVVVVVLLARLLGTSLEQGAAMHGGSEVSYLRLTQASGLYPTQKKIRVPAFRAAGVSHHGGFFLRTATVARSAKVAYK
jgi:hypothetical protein